MNSNAGFGFSQDPYCLTTAFGFIGMNNDAYAVEMREGYIIKAGMLQSNNARFYF